MMMNQEIRAAVPSAPPFMIRRAQPEDHAPLSQMLTASYGALLAADYHKNILAAALPILGRARPDLLASGRYFVADSGAGTGTGDMLGSGGWSWQGPVGGAAPLDWGYMRHVAVAPAHCGQGIGRVLLGHILDHAGANGVRVMNCFSTLSAAAFYERMGFVRRAEVALTLAPGLSFPVVEMRRRL